MLCLTAGEPDDEGIARVGTDYCYWNLKGETCINSVPANRSDNGFDVAAGIGAQYFLTSRFAVRAEFEYLPNVGNANTVGDTDHQLWTIGGVWKF